MTIPRNSNDVLIKHLSTALSDGVLDVIGLHGVEIECALPTEQDQVQVTQEFTDIVWALRDGSILHMEVQTTRPKSLHRFLRYDVWLSEQFQAQVRTVVLYSAAVSAAPDGLDMGCAQYRVDNIYLKEFDGDDTLRIVAAHLVNGTWEPADRIRLALAMQMRHDQWKRDVFERVLELTRQIPDECEQAYVTTLILGINGNRLTKEQKQRLRRDLEMMNIVKEIWHDVLDEGIEKGMKQGMEKGVQTGLQQGLQQGMEKGMQKGVQQGLGEGKREVARLMLGKGMDLSEIVELTGLSRAEVAALQKRA